MKKTLQDQYLLIKEGKGHKGVFLAEAKSQFPHIVRNAATFDEAAASLKTKHIIFENIIGTMPINTFEPAKKQSYELAFESFLAEAKSKSDEDEMVKAEEKKVSKNVEEYSSHNFDTSNTKNPDNLIFDQIMMGYYTEIKDSKNEDKTMQELKDIVLKNLAKDPIHYTKEGQFGITGLGYATEHPGLGTPEEPKGQYKSSGYGDLDKVTKSKLNESQLRKSINDINTVNEGSMMNRGLDDIEEEGYEDGEEAIETFKFKHFQNQPDLTAYTKGFIQGIRDNGIYFVNESEGEVEIVKYNGEDHEVVKTKEGLMIQSTDRLAEEVKIRTAINTMVRQQIQENIQKELQQINKEAEHEVLDKKIEKLSAAIEKRQKQLSRLDEDEDLKSLTDDKKVKAISKDIKTLEKAKLKLEKISNKTKNIKKEVIDEVEEETEMEPSEAYMIAKQDAEDRYDEGEDIDSILDTILDLTPKEKNMLRLDLEGKNNGMDY